MLPVLLAAAVQFALPSKDGLATIRGEIDVPACAKASAPAVLMIGGTGLFTRDAFFGDSGTDRDLVFKDLSARISARCLITVRFDYRGVGCELRSKDDIPKCLDQNLRKTVTSETILDDIQVVYDRAIAEPRIDASKLFFLGHSEGSMNAARLVARKSVAPAGLFFIGGVTESARGIVHWQIAERPVLLAMELDANHDDVLTNDEVEKGYATSTARYYYSKEQLMDSSGQTTRAAITTQLESLWKAVEANAAAHKPSDPYPVAGTSIVFTSYEWWQRWIFEDVPMLENLKDFEGPIRYHNGDYDSQTPGLREREILRSSTVPMKSRPEFIVHPGLGHGFRAIPHMGPFDEAVADQFADELAAWALAN